MTELVARLLASKDRDWQAVCRSGEWMVWSARADHVVEFAPNMLKAAEAIVNQK